MKNYLLFTTLLSCFLPAFNTSATNIRGLLHAIINQNTIEALHLIDQGVADYAGPDRLHKITLAGPHIHAECTIPLLALACCLNLNPVIKALLARGHSPHECITAVETCIHGHKQVSILTTLEITQKFFHPEALQALMRHLEAAPLERQDQARKRHPLLSPDGPIGCDYEPAEDDLKMMVA